MKKAPQGSAARDSKKTFRASAAVSFRLVVQQCIAIGSKLAGLSIRAFGKGNV